MALGTLGIIGLGNMGSAIVGGLIKSNIYMPSDIHVYDIDGDKLAKAKNRAFRALLNTKTRRIIRYNYSLTVKPKDVEGVLNGLKKISNIELLISIAAGVSTTKIESVLTPAPSRSAPARWSRRCTRRRVRP